MASWNDRSWPLRRWLADKLIGRRAYTRGVSHNGMITLIDCSYGSTGPGTLPFDQERS